MVQSQFVQLAGAISRVGWAVVDAPVEQMLGQIQLLGLTQDFARLTDLATAHPQDFELRGSEESDNWPDELLGFVVAARLLVGLVEDLMPPLVLVGVGGRSSTKPSDSQPGSPGRTRASQDNSQSPVTQ